jgi:hypothetical protein
MNMDQHMAALLAEWGARPFAWGTTDCCQFARAAAWQIHRVAVDAPAYNSERGARRVLDGMGGYAGLMHRAGFHARPLAAARRGDFVVVEHKGPGLFLHGLGLVTGLQAHAPTRLGLLALDRTVWLECWGPTQPAGEVAHA